ncbi:hypothetical protein [Methylobrevis pamukkalensis]|uniref:Uncharacterized protein n=1 Tax=Methylobrevis pamukkalensis TaxID=1439726 RepID=A0A1E3H508_9HYPH|nr:hypothetical protein [Methylobrevis pamukkalensis]ODN71392.1 hypothetical protein A6302_01256 [Methylobrevis pamukkalensis]
MTAAKPDTVRVRTPGEAAPRRPQVAPVAPAPVAATPVAPVTAEATPAPTITPSGSSSVAATTISAAAAAAVAASLASDEDATVNDRSERLKTRFRKRRDALRASLGDETATLPADDMAPQDEPAPVADANVGPEMGDLAPLAALVQPWVDVLANPDALDVPVQVVLVAAATRRSGHRELADALAFAAADAGLRTVLLETEPDAASALGGRDGLLDVLLGVVSLDEALVEIPGRPLTVLPFGSAESGLPVHAPLEMPELLELLESLRGRYAAVIIKGPAAGGEPHLAGLVGQSDAVLMVAEEGRIGHRAAEIALEGLAPHEDCVCRLLTWPRAEASDRVAG